MRATKLAISGAGLPRISWRRSVRSSIRSSSRATRSAGVTVAKNGSSPASIASSCSMRAQKSWKVVTQSDSNGVSRSASSRSRIWFAAEAEKVTARIESAGVPCLASHSKRAISTRVLPVPAPPTISTGPPGCRAASSWASVRPRAAVGIAPSIRAAMAAAMGLDWPEICRRAGNAAQSALDGLGTTAQRSERLGRGEGGDTTLAVDRAAEDAIVALLEETGAPLTLVSEERGEMELAGGGPVHVVLDPIDGSLNAKRAMAPYSVSIAVASGRTMGDVRYAYVRDLSNGEEFTAAAGEGARLGGEPLPPLPPDARVQLLGGESAQPRLVAAAAGALDETFADRLRMPGSIALTLCFVSGRGPPRGR